MVSCWVRGAPPPDEAGPLGFAAKEVVGKLLGFRAFLVVDWQTAIMVLY